MFPLIFSSLFNFVAWHYYIKLHSHSTFALLILFFSLALFRSVHTQSKVPSMLSSFHCYYGSFSHHLCIKKSLCFVMTCLASSSPKNLRIMYQKGI
ncbi:hypothetical protein BJV82DRAFT_585421 [Fennellomyces sp. T-0311]|nr:hypothetical protein BJV82DRAFT_585421 [Fennellomyces sp. T-0311]